MSSALSGWIIVIKKCGDIPHGHIWSESDFHDTALWLSGVITLSCVFMLTNRPHDVCRLTTAEAVIDQRAHGLDLVSARRIYRTLIRQLSGKPRYAIKAPSLLREGLSFLSQQGPCLCLAQLDPSSWVVSGLSCVITVPRCSKKTRNTVRMPHFSQIGTAW